MDLRNALHSLRTHRPVQFCGTSEIPKILGSKRVSELPTDSSSTVFQKATPIKKVFQLDEVVKEDIDLDLSDDEFFQDAALLDLSDCDSQTLPTDQPQFSSSLSPDTASTQVSPLGSHTSTSSAQTRGTPCRHIETVSSFKPLVSAQSTSQQQPRASCSNTSQRLRSFSFTKLPTRPHPANGTGEENAAKRIALDITTTVTSGANCLLLSQSSHNVRSTSSLTPMHTPERTRKNLLSQREFLSNTFTTPTNTPQNTSDDFTPRSTVATSVLTPVNRAVTVTPTNSEHSAKRKFPGPAGILPKLIPGQSMDSLKVVTPLTASPVSTPRARRIAAVNTDLPSSQGCSIRQEFCQGPWVRIVEEFEKYESHLSVLLQTCIFNVIKQASQRKLAHGKVSLLRAMIKSIVPTGKSASAVLKDPSGEMLASIHFKVMGEYQSVLQPGCVLALQQTSVFSPSRCKHYLNITLSNLVCVCPVDNTQLTMWCSVLDDSSLIQYQHQPVTGQHQPVTVQHQPVTAHHQPVTAQHQSLLHTNTTSNSTTMTTSTISDMCHRPYELVEEINEDEFDMLLKDMDDSFFNP